MDRITLFSMISVGVLVVLAAIWFATRDRLDESFENAPVSVVASLPEAVPEEENIKTTETTSPAISPVPPASSPEPPKLDPTPPATPSVEGLDIRPKLIAFGYRVPPSARSIDTVVIHSSYNASGGDVYDIDKIIKQYEDYGVGAHYLIGRAGTIYRLVEEHNIAYHAGVSKMPDGRRNINDFSVGIELVGTETSGYTEKQYAVLNTLIADLKGRYPVKHLVGHADIAPDRKTDPWKFDWKKLK